VPPDDSITDIETISPIASSRTGNSVSLWIQGMGEVWAKITAVVTGVTDAGGTSRTAYEWRKQQMGPGGQWADSDDLVSGFTTESTPRQEPLFSTDPAATYAVNTIVRIRPGVRDTHSPSTSHGLEWWIDTPKSSGSWFVRFTLAAALAKTDASKTGTTVDDYWGGPSPGSTITVYNLPASTNYIFFGASGHKGLATYDDRNAKWWIIQLECP
jgi:hypothetical protein